MPFVRVFPVSSAPSLAVCRALTHSVSQMFVARIESQLDGADDLNIRKIVNSQYERIVATMFDCLQQMAKMDGEGHGSAGEGKDQLNYHVILIGACTVTVRANKLALTFQTRREHASHHRRLFEQAEGPSSRAFRLAGPREVRPEPGSLHSAHPTATARTAARV